MTAATVSARLGWIVAVAAIAAGAAACQDGSRREARAARAAADDERGATYQSDVEESLGAAVAILVDTSGSMRQEAPGENRPKHIVAQEALEAMLDATETFIRKRPDFPIKIGLYSFPN